MVLAPSFMSISVLLQKLLGWTSTIVCFLIIRGSRANAVALLSLCKTTYRLQLVESTGSKLGTRTGREDLVALSSKWWEPPSNMSSVV